MSRADPSGEAEANLVGAPGPDCACSAGKHASSSEASVEQQGGDVSYQETERFCTWRKHTRDLYQQLFHVDLVWESPVAQLMPYVTVKGGLTTHTILCATRTGGQEQCFLQMLSATLPNTAESLDSVLTPFCEATGEVGGFGMAPHQCGLKDERRILHDGDVLAARYMPANPLLLASCSSDTNLYIFDWSRVSLNRYPNDPPRPRAPLPPNELSSNPTEEERANYNKRMRALNAIAIEQDRWDRRTGEGQHVLTLVGGSGPSDNLDWSTAQDGLLASGSKGRLCVWQVANLSKEDPRTVQPLHTFHLDDEEISVTNVSFSWAVPHGCVTSASSGSVYYNDTRAAESTEVFSLSTPTTTVTLSPLDSNSLLVGDEEGRVYFFDLRNSVEPVLVERLHEGEVTCAQWCPHSPHLFATGGADGYVCVYNHTRCRQLFKHSGHTDSIMDLGWNWQTGCAGQLISADANALMLWRPRDCFFYN